MSWSPAWLKLAEPAQSEPAWASSASFSCRSSGRARWTLCPELISAHPQLGCSCAWGSHCGHGAFWPAQGTAAPPALGRAAGSACVHPCSPRLPPWRSTGELHHPARFPAFLTPCVRRASRSGTDSLIFPRSWLCSHSCQLLNSPQEQQWLYYFWCALSCGVANAIPFYLIFPLNTAVWFPLVSISTFAPLDSHTLWDGHGPIRLIRLAHSFSQPLYLESFESKLGHTGLWLHSGLIFIIIQIVGIVQVAKLSTKVNCKAMRHICPTYLTQPKACGIAYRENYDFWTKAWNLEVNLTLVITGFMYHGQSLLFLVTSALRVDRMLDRPSGHQLGKLRKSEV